MCLPSDAPPDVKSNEPPVGELVVMDGGFGMDGVFGLDGGGVAMGVVAIVGGVGDTGDRVGT